MKSCAWAILFPKYYYTEEESHSSLWKVTRSMTPEICWVAGRRSGMAAVMIGDSILPRMDGAWMIHRGADSARTWLPGEVQVGLLGLKCRMKCLSHPEHKTRASTGLYPLL
jgi:hypothetical protein